jgi:hypothetical protein
LKLTGVSFLHSLEKHLQILALARKASAKIAAVEKKAIGALYHA